MLKSSDVANTPIVCHRLVQQYRMPPEILHWPNKYHYNERIISACGRDGCSFSPYTVVQITAPTLTNIEQEIDFIVDFVKPVIDDVRDNSTDGHVYTFGLVTPFADVRGKLLHSIR